MDWRMVAACADATDPDAWFSDLNTVDGLRAVEYAKGFCRSCSVRAECLEWALATDQRWGVWGGRTNAERGWYDHSTRVAPKVARSAGRRAQQRA